MAKAKKQTIKAKLRQAPPNPPISIIEACQDEHLFLPIFKDMSTWQAWMTFLKVVFALPIESEAERELIKQCTQRDVLPSKRVNEGWLVCGRRAGKSQIVAVIAAYLATFFDWRPYLSLGERGVIMVIASDRKQARVIFRYLNAVFDLPLFKDLVERDTQEMLELKNQITIEVQTANFRAVRGYTIVAALLDEIAFWRSEETANPDDEILAALRPAMATIPGAMILAASSPYARRGVLWETYRRHFGKPEEDMIVWQAPTRLMNPSVPQSFIDREYSKDAAKADAEYGANFRKDIETYVPIEVVEACTDWGCTQRPPSKDVHYTAFVDPSGGSRDSFTVAIAHSDTEGNQILDVLEEFKAPLSPNDTIEQIAKILKLYHVSKCTGDRYAGEWPVEAFEKHGITYEQHAEPKSILYRDLLPLLNSGKARLLDNPTLRSQLVALERRTARGGRDIIDHPPGGHDDVVNAAAGALTLEPGLEVADLW